MISTFAQNSSAVPAGTSYVTTTNDSGPGSLRQAMLNLNGTNGSATIAFNLPGSGPFTINLLSPLPPITVPV
ncbi:MAG TPA: hypothetical protein VFB72_03620 [Verrucomicrobiae bacterium]|nr:hypothetical protein [Verrucomicrobiae bacterium]